MKAHANNHYNETSVTGMIRHRKHYSRRSLIFFSVDMLQNKTAPYSSCFKVRYHRCVIIYSVSSSSSSSSVICQTTGPKPLPKWFLHLTRSRASCFKWQYPLLSPRSSSSFLRLLPRLLLTSICPFIFPSITSFRRQFLRKIWPIQ
jgi:hypothetical protein